MKNKKVKKNKSIKNCLNKNNYLVIIGILLIVLIVVIAFNKKDDLSDKKNNNKDKNNVVEVANNNPGVVDDKEQDGLSFTNTMLLTSNNKSTLTTLVSNLTESDIDVRIFEIYIKDKTGNLMVTLQGYVGDVVPVGESREIVSYVDMNLKDAFNVEYKLIK